MHLNVFKQTDEKSFFNTLLKAAGKGMRLDICDTTEYRRRIVIIHIVSSVCSEKET